MKIFEQFNIYGWMTLILGVFVGIIVLLMVQSFWSTLDVNAQLIIFGLFATMLIAVSTKASMRKGSK